MQTIEKKDKLTVEKNKEFVGLLEREEHVLWSGNVLKINKKGKRQNRDFVITTQSIYNVGDKNTGLFSSLFSKKLKRQFKLKKIKAVSYSIFSNNFILHLPEEYDYYLCTPDKDEFLTYVIHARERLKCPDLEFYLTQDIDLFRYSKTEGEKTDKRPNVKPQNMGAAEFKKMVDKSKLELNNSIINTEVVVSADDKNVNEGSFEVLKLLGKGYFGRVFLVQKKDNDQLYALKVIPKIDIIKKNSFDNLKNEKRILMSVNHPFVVNLEYFFISPSYVFFAMKFKQGGELYHHLKKLGRFSEEVARFYACQVLSGLEYLHSKKILYRDMKPENILLDADGNCCLADFGISKELDDAVKTKSFVGTPEYVAPEVILQKGYDKAIDIWCFGVLLFEMVFGAPPFHNKNQSALLATIVKQPLAFPKHIAVSENLTDLISKVL